MLTPPTKNPQALLTVALDSDQFRKTAAEPGNHGEDALFIRWQRLFRQIAP